MPNRRTKRRKGGPFRFRVSDSLAVPLRGHLLRLRLLEGEPVMADLDIGRKLRVRSPTGVERTITILDHAVTGGKPTQERLERTGELDVIISTDDAGTGASLVDIGWVASEPPAEGNGR